MQYPLSISFLEFWSRFGFLRFGSDLISQVFKEFETDNESFEIKLTKCLPQTNISIVIHAYKELKTTPQEFLSL